jgi:AcrR family transcriptional regulator
MIDVGGTEEMARRNAGSSKYHHGDLANALVEAAFELARSGGPQAIVLREAARRVGVSVSAAYRHFTGHRSLVGATKSRAQEFLLKAMAAEPVEKQDNPADQAMAQVLALGRGYVRFAQAEPGLFRTAFDENAPTEQTSESFALLSKALDRLVASGAMRAAARPGAETPVWSAVHGLAELMLDGGPLSRLSDAEKFEETERTLDFINHALVSME